MAANKTPFEVRLDVLRMAQEMLDREHQIDHIKFAEKLEAMRKDKAPTESLIAFIDSNAPKMYSPSDVVARSTALYNFVNDTTRNKP